eukprot:749456-Pyramimonas_sp.AAC.1
MRRFRMGAELADLPCLETLSARLLFVLVSERGAERPHALMHKEISHAPSASAPYLSLSLRLGSLKSSLIDNPSELTALAKICTGVYHPLTAAPALRVESHPDLDEAWRSAVDASTDEVSLVLGSTKDHDRVFKNVVYHLDRVS